MKKKPCKLCEILKASLVIILLLSFICFFSVLLVGLLDQVFGKKMRALMQCDSVYNVKISKQGEYYIGSFEYREPSGKGGTVILGSRKSADAVMDGILNNYCK